MRRVHLILLASAALAAGCIGGNDDGAAPDDGGNESADDDGMATAYPAPINDTKQVTGSADPGNLAPGGQPCATPSSKCFRYPFQMNATGNVTAKLTWGVAASDFDLYVFAEGKPHADSPSPSNPPGTSESLTLELEPGEYELVVVAWGVAQDTYKVEATFGAAPTS